MQNACMRALTYPSVEAVTIATFPGCFMLEMDVVENAEEELAIKLVRRIWSVDNNISVV